ncbi:MAG: sulfite exporter TauE/SafE family protein [Bacteroidetes bacterium]|jgi:uncharacterized membrane protein YfcA|nr:sulfite exporter TauE/SafE family protein [Bacteroidota bacterium]MBP9136174.1 sulfite exporter TauE/SafE family protein [Chitinophagales bacterium]
MENLLYFAVIINFFASIVFCTFGFGDSMLAIPILSTFLPLKIATPFMCMTGLILSVTLIIKEAKSLAWKDAIYLVFGSFLGVPIGVYFLKNGNDLYSRLGLAGVIIFISIFKIFYKGNIVLKKDWYGIPFGFLGGIMSGAFNMSGPAVVIFGTLKKWPPKKFVATLQAYFLPTNFLALFGFYTSDVLTNDVLKMVLYALPGLVFAIFIGGKLNRKMKPQVFEKYINYFLLIIGFLLIFTTLNKLMPTIIMK